MEISEIVRRNEAIAKFMGIDTLFPPPEFREEYVSRRDDLLLMKLGYERDWRALMPVVEKILTHRTSMIGSMGTLIREESGEFTVMLAGGNIGKEPTMIEAIFLAVSEYCLALQEPKS